MSWFSIEYACQELSRFRDYIKSGQLISAEGSVLDPKDNIGSLWHFPIVQDKLSLLMLLQLCYLSQKTVSEVCGISPLFKTNCLY
jgi:hypothetical protein